MLQMEGIQDKHETRTCFRVQVIQPSGVLKEGIEDLYKSFRRGIQSLSI